MKIIQNNSQFTFVDNNVNFFDKLPNKVFSIEYNKQTNQYYLEQEEFDSFKIPDKIYGNSYEIADKIISKYNRRDKNLGVLLTGLKGSGKSLTSKIICNKSNRPVLILKHWFTDTTLMEFLSNITQEFVLSIDEFEKIFSAKESQHKILSLLDGWSNNKILFLLTSNGSPLSHLFHNRPSRIHYSIEFEAPSLDFLKEVLTDKLINKEHTKNLLRLCNIIGDVNLDTFISIIEEVNETNESNINDLLYYLNIKPDTSNYIYQVINEKEGWFIEGNCNKSPLLGYNYDEAKRNISDKKHIKDSEDNFCYFDEWYETSDYTNIEITEKGFRFEDSKEGLKFIFEKQQKTQLLF